MPARLTPLLVLTAPSRDTCLMATAAGDEPLKVSVTRLASKAALLLAVMACAPEPTTPATTDLGGSWTSSARLSTLSNLRMNLVQEPRGLVSGGWTAKGEGGGGGCSPSTPCNASGHLIGRNTIARVELELLGAGKFEGVLAEQDRLRGAFLAGTAADTITFFRISR